MPAPVTGRRSPGGEDGVSLIELVVAVLVLSIATVGVYRVLASSVRVVGDEEDRLIAGAMARNQAELLGLPEAYRSDLVPLGDRDWTVRSDRETTRAGFTEVEIVVTRDGGGPAARLVTYVSGRP